MDSRLHRQTSSRTASSACSSSSQESGHTRSTAPTVYSDRPPIKHHNTCPQPHIKFETSNFNPRSTARASVETYASTTASTDDINEQLPYETPSERYDTILSGAIPTISSEFAVLFAAHRPIHVHHDDSTADGNMNLRLDLETYTEKGRIREMTLFHLRMQDLSKRQFSLRRYCRDSGREICHSDKKQSRQAPPLAQTTARAKRPTLQRSMSNTLASLVGRRKAGADIEINERPVQRVHDSIHLEFSNYAQVDIHPCRVNSSKAYDFEYWGTSYRWRREGRHRSYSASYHLVDLSSGMPVAHITPDPLSRQERAEEEYRGGWIPPCSMTVTDEDAFSTDLADVIVAAGLVALADDCINKHWHSRSKVERKIPVRTTSEYVTSLRRK